jgi:signal transduction histidine kinase
MDGVPRPLKRQYLITAVVFLGLLGGAFALFAKLLVAQLSRSYLDDVLLSGKAHAEEVARTIQGDEPLYKVVERRRESLDRISEALSRQEVVDTVQVYDPRGKLVYQTSTATDGLTGGFPDSNVDLWTPSSPENVVETQREYQIRTPVKDIGTVVVKIPKAALGGRIDELRRRLLVSAATAGGVAMAVLALAVAFIWHLVKRNAELEGRRFLAEEMAALGSLAANLAHEIRNPLNALSINLELLEEDISSRQGDAGGVDLARREVGRLTRLVNDFLVYARPTPPAREAFEGVELLEEVAELLRPGAERDGVKLEVQGQPTTIWADRGQIYQVLVNLTQNACQALASSAQKVVVLGVLDVDGATHLEVRDTGPGIPEGELGLVRQAFFSRRKGGTGLGLAIAERIVAGHGGRLELANRPTGGLVARIVLPSREAETV